MTQSRSRRLLRPLALALAALPLFVLTTPAALAQEVQASEVGRATRQAILAIAERYASFAWTATARNVLHGEDENGTRVDTPDADYHEGGWRADGSTNQGMPYAWGGFTSVEEFEAGLGRGLYAGLVPTSERAGASAQALGVDCSGYVARCWDLPVKQSTRSLGALCFELEDFAALEPGDIANKFDSHVVLFKEWVDEGTRERARVYEAGAWKVQVSEYDVAAMRANGFVPMRYRPLDARWISMDQLRAQAASEEGVTWTDRTGAPPLVLGDVQHPLADARALEWARYAVNDRSSRGELSAESQSERTTLIARVEGAIAWSQTLTSLLGGELPTGAEHARAGSLTDVLIDFADFSEPLSQVRWIDGGVEPVQVEFDGTSFTAQRITGLIEAERVVRHKAFALTIELECLLSEELPVHGVAQARYVIATDWGPGTDGEPQIVERVLELELTAFGGPAR